MISVTGPQEPVTCKTKMVAPVRRPAFLSCKLEQVIPEEDGHLVVFQQLAALVVLTVAAVEDVERTVILGVLQVLCVVLHLHLHRVAVIVFATFKLLVSVFAFEALQGPFLPSGPVLLAAEQDHGLVGPLEALDEVLRRKMAGIHTLHTVLEHSRSHLYNRNQTGTYSSSNRRAVRTA